MGLDFVEIIMAVEEEFGIKIPENVSFYRYNTPGKMHAFVVRQLKAQARAACPTSRIFYELRRGALAAGLCLREVFRPSTSLERLAPVKLERRDQWDRWRKETDAPLPDLEHATRVSKVIRTATLAATALGGLWAGATAYTFTQSISITLWTALFGSVISGGLAFRGLARFCQTDQSEFPHQNRTVADLVRSLAAAEPTSATQATAYSIDEDAVWRRLRHTLAVQLGTNEEEITREADFFRDLGAD